MACFLFIIAGQKGKGTEKMKKMRREGVKGG